jgi:uncharacterized protein YdaU (DUF1376 family)
VAATQGISLEEDGLYNRILDAMWNHRGLPLDEAEQAKICRVHLRTFRRLTGKKRRNNRETSELFLQNIFATFVVKDGRLWHPKLWKEWENAVKRQEVAKHNAKKRWDK